MAGATATPNVTIEANQVVRSCPSLPHGTLVHRAAWKLLQISLYFGIGCAFYMTKEGWGGIETIYFLMVTASTVGYGDMGQTDGWGRLFTVFMIFYGMLAVFALSTFVGEAFLPIFRYMRNLLENLTPQAGIDIDGDGCYDFKVPRRPFLFYSKSLSCPITFVFCIQLICAAIFSVIEGWDFGKAFYHCVVTATTVGYGDISITTSAGRIFAIFHIVISVSLLAALIGDVNELAEERKAALHKLTLLKGRLDLDLMRTLDRDGNGVDKFEFVIGMLVKLEVIVPEDYEPFEKVFNTMDADGSGFLTEADMMKAAEATRGGQVSTKSGQTLDLAAIEKSIKGRNDDVLKDVLSATAANSSHSATAYASTAGEALRYMATSNLTQQTDDFATDSNPGQMKKNKTSGWV